MRHVRRPRQQLLVVLATTAPPRRPPPVHALQQHFATVPRFGGEVASASPPTWLPSVSPKCIRRTDDDVDVVAEGARGPVGKRGGLAALVTLRGGCRERRQRVKRPLTSFVPPGIVWLLTAYVDYALWWKLIPSVVAAGSSAGRSRGVGEAITSHPRQFALFHVLLVLALLSHVMVMAADPGFIPSEAQLPAHGSKSLERPWRWCDRCKAFKPPRAHHCRRCGACVARMDHHCIYAANCVGAGNHKQFLLLLLYSGACAAHALALSRQFLWSRLASPNFFVLCAAFAGIVGLDRRVGDDRVGDRQGFPPGGGVSGGILLCSGFVAMLLAWLVALLIVQCHGIAVEAGTVDRLQQAWTTGRTPKQQASVARDKRASLALLGSLSTMSTSPARTRKATDVASTLGPTFRSNRLKAANSQADLPRGTRSGRAPDPSVVGAWWKALREEILGEGPWVMWFLPTRAKLTPRAAGRVYSGGDDTPLK